VTRIPSGRRGALAFGTAFVALAAAAAPVRAQTVAIVGGTVYPVSGPRIENGTVLIRDGRIVAVGANVAVPADAQRVDATGKIVTPGLVNGATQLGVVEIGSVAGTRDASARGTEGIAASFRVTDAFNPRSTLLPPARQDGITTAVVAPGAGLVAGQAGVVDLASRSGRDDVTEMIRRNSAAMVVQLEAGGGGEGAPGGRGGSTSRGETLGRLRELLSDARAYRRTRAAYERGDSRQLSAGRADLEALQPVLDGTLPMLVIANRAADIEASLRLAREFGARLIIGEGAEAWRVADQLAAARVPVLTGAMNNIPTTFSTLGQRQENAALLDRAGVSVAIIGNAGGGDEEAFNARNVRFEAGNAVAYGLPWDKALRAVTLGPAEIFGVADRVGALAPGRDANVVVWSGDPFEFATRAERVFVRGRELREETRQELLTRRYRTLPGTSYRP
jgi:imidazolonepropionase-like amidohydrolase